MTSAYVDLGEPARRRVGFFASHRWPVATILVYVACSAAAFTPRFVDYLVTGAWGLSATRAVEFAPTALNIHALFGMALIPLYAIQPLIGARLMSANAESGAITAHRRLGWFLALAAGALSSIGLYITYVFSQNTDSVTSVVFMFLVAFFVIVYFAQAVVEARRGRINRHLDALVFAIIFLSVPATGRLIEAAMRSAGVDNTRSRDLISLGGGFQVELVDVTILLIAAAPLAFWLIYATPRGVLRAHFGKLGVATAFFALPFGAIVAQTIGR